MSGKLKKIIIAGVFFIILLCINSKVHATTISFNPNNPKVGDTVNITISIQNVNTATLKANVSGAVSGTIQLVKGDPSGNPSSFSESKSFKCDKEGKITVAITSDSSAVLNGNYVDVGASATISVAPKETPNENPPPSENPEPPATTVKSNNADLKNLGINPNDFKGFKSGTTSYDVTVPNNVEQVKVYATAKDSKANVSGTGNKNLNVGQNALKVVVTAEDGTTKTYTINVTREADGVTNTTEENTNTVENPDMDLSNYDLTELSVPGYTLSPEFSPYIYEYTLDISSEDVTKLDINTKTKNDEKIKVEIVGNEELKEGENIVTILVTNEVTGDNATYQIIVNKTNEIDLSAVNESLDSNVEKANRVRKIIIGVIAFIVLGIIIFVVVKYRMKNKYDDEDFEYDENDEDNDDDEEENNEIENNEVENEVENDEEKPKALQNNMVEEKEEERVEEKVETKMEGLEDIKQKSKQNDDIIIQEPEPEQKSYRKNNGKGKHF